MKKALIDTVVIFFNASKNAHKNAHNPKRNSTLKSNEGDFHVFGGNVYINGMKSGVKPDHVERLESINMVHEFKSHWFCLTASAFELCTRYKEGNKQAFDRINYVKPEYDTIESEGIRPLKIGEGFTRDLSNEMMYKSMITNTNSPIK